MRTTAVMLLVLIGLTGAVTAGPQENRVWVAKSRAREGCAGVMFAITQRPGGARLQVDGVEQLLDTAWRVDWEMGVEDRQEWRFDFIDPVGGGSVACRTARVRCLQGGRSRTGTRICDPTGIDKRDTRREGGPRLAIRAPHFVMARVGQHAAPVRIVVEVLGQATEDWWCPEIEVRWPDGTRSEQSADCDPWSGQQEPQSWTFRHWLAAGENVIHVRAYRAGRAIGAGRARVKVIGL